MIGSVPFTLANHAVAIAMFGWIPVVLALFAWLPARRAALAGFLLAWMFLPYTTYKIQGLPDYTKTAATCGGVLLGVAIFDFRRLLSLRPVPADLPILLFCLCPFASSVTNGLGVHDGFSAVFDRTLTWGIPWAIGRMYFSDLSSLRELAIGLCAGGVVYIPFCVWEMLYGPGLHRLIYGYYQPFLDQEPRFGILRPMVFMDSGLMVAVWMATATVLGAWLWNARVVPARRQRTIVWATLALAATTLAMRSVNGWVLTGLGVGLLAIHTRWRSAAPLLAVMALLVAYVFVRATGLWSGQEAVPVVAGAINAAKGRSVNYRFLNENLIVGNMRGRRVVGWGRQAAALDDHRGGVAVPDSLWVIAFSQSGMVGLLAMMGMLLAPAIVFIRRCPAVRWREAAVAPAAALAVAVVLYSVDNLANAMVNPVFMLAAGGLTGIRRAAARMTASGGRG